MNDLDFGARDARGDWRPDEPLRAAPVFVLPPKPARRHAVADGAFAVGTGAATDDSRLVASSRSGPGSRVEL